MNFKQIRTLNYLESKVAELLERVSELEKDSQEEIDDFVSLEHRVEALEDVRENDLERIRLLENPPKRPRGRPRKVNG